ncbi:MAG: hypothetical protein CVV34_00590 [Methanomicrobiales archaeon HGW-Methanomicrobiales-5]|nr:MAG: hypothetical protein CVV34_00590 [Methanomicrobiales archaeon HGW-Methanomicrobiales-5]
MQNTDPFFHSPISWGKQDEPITGYEIDRSIRIVIRQPIFFIIDVFRETKIFARSRGRTLPSGIRRIALP